MSAPFDNYIHERKSLWGQSFFFFINKYEKMKQEGINKKKKK